MSILGKLFSGEDPQLDKGLETTKKSFFSKLSTAIAGRSTVDMDVLDDLEEVLIMADAGVPTTLKIIEAIEARVAKDKYLGTDALRQILQEEIRAILVAQEKESDFSFAQDYSQQPHVIMVVGVNGVGKTTTIGKLAHQFTQAGKKVVLGAADTFRAGAIDQLQVWADRSEVSLVKQEMGSDPASVAFDTLQSAVKQQADVVLIDTAGRLHNKVNLMNELTKLKRVMDTAPKRQLLLVGRFYWTKRFEQAKQFTAATEVTALAITKLDGTAKGGVVMGISDQFQIPVKFIGVGEGIEDLKIFDSAAFVHSFFN